MVSIGNIDILSLATIKPEPLLEFCAERCLMGGRGLTLLVEHIVVICEVAQVTPDSQIMPIIEYFVSSFYNAYIRTHQKRAAAV